MPDDTSGQYYLTSPIQGDEYLEEQRQRAIQRSSFMDRLRSRDEGEERNWFGPDTLCVSRMRVEQDGETIIRRCFTDDQGCVLTSEDVWELLGIASEIHEVMDDEDIEQFNVNQREREFMRWVELNSGESYEDHIYGIGRPKRRKGKRKHRPGFVYVAQAGDDYKIGRSAEPKTRVKALRGLSGESVRLVLSVASDDAVDLENELHVRYRDKHIQGEWFGLSSDDLGDIERNYGGGADE